VATADYFSAVATNSKRAALAGSSGVPRLALMRAVGGVAGSEEGALDSRIPQHGIEPLGLGGRFGMLRDKQRQKRRNPLVFRDVRHRGEIDVLGGIVAEFFPVAVFRLRLLIDRAAQFCSRDDLGNVERVAIDRTQPFSILKESPSALR
jgi:hypothetical protein